MYEKYQPLLDYLATKTPYKYELVLKKNYEETVNSLGSGETSVALLGPLTYLEARAKYGAVSILKSRGVDGTTSYRSVIITKKDSPVRTLAELKGKKRCLCLFQIHIGESHTPLSSCRRGNTSQRTRQLHKL